MKFHHLQASDLKVAALTLIDSPETDKVGRVLLSAARRFAKM